MTIVRDGFVSVLQPRRPEEVGKSEVSAALATESTFFAPPGIRNCEKMATLEVTIALRRDNNVDAISSSALFFSADASTGDVDLMLVC